VRSRRGNLLSCIESEGYQAETLCRMIAARELAVLRWPQLVNM
jgi:hypothetical protein